MAKVALFHTSVATLPLMKDLVEKYMPDIDVMHIIEEAMIKEVMVNKGVSTNISSRILSYVKAAESAGCELFMTACSSIGLAVEQCQPFTDMSVSRIDTAMIKKALESGHKISVLATVATTMAPTVEYVERMAKESRMTPEIETLLMPKAFEALLKGDMETHDQIVKTGLDRSLTNSDVVVLAQASMARVIPKGFTSPVPVLTSPELGIQYLASQLK